MRVRGKAEMCIPLPSKRKAQSVYVALCPETRVTFGPRSSVSIKLHGKSLFVTLLAEDTTALRAIINSYLRWIASCLDTVNAISKIPGSHKTQ